MRREYPNGYIPKIQYWNGKLQYAISQNNWVEVEYCMKKMNHFVSRQYVVENQQPFTPVVNGAPTFQI
jgi:hypothetical protein